MSETTSDQPRASNEKPSGHPRDRHGRSDVGPALFVLVLGIVTVWLAAGVSDEFATDALGGSFLPRTLGVLLIVLALGLLIKDVLKSKKEIDVTAGLEGESPMPGGSSGDHGSRDPVPPPPGGKPRDTAPGRRRVLVFMGLMAAYTLLLGVLGYLLASFLAFSAMIFVAGERRPLRATAGAVVMTAFLYVLFAVVFDIGVPRGIIFP